MPPERYCRALSAKGTHREPMRLDGRYDEAQTYPLPHDELVELQRRAQEARLTANLTQQGDDWECAV